VDRRWIVCLCGGHVAHPRPADRENAGIGKSSLWILTTRS
jgi:hypothetical protein